MTQILGEIFFFLCLKGIPAFFFTLITVFTLQIARTSTKTHQVRMCRECNAGLYLWGQLCYIPLFFSKLISKHIFPERSIAASCV